MNVVNHPKVAVLRLAIPVGVCIAFLFSQPSPAQQQPAFQQPSAVNPVQWLAGPRKANFGDVAEINIPDGFQFLDAAGGRFFLEGMHNPVPPNLVGILAPTSTKWYAVVKYSGLGYVKDTDAGQLDAAVMLDKIRGLISRQNVPISSADWEIKPSYDPAQNKLEWAIRVVTSGDVATVNYSVQLFGRQGIMEIVAVQPQADFDPAPLQEMVKNISFQSGARYSDYQPGDKVAKATLAQLSLYENGPDSPAVGRKGHKFLWIGIAGGIVLLVGAGWTMKKLSHRSRSTDGRRQAVAQRASQVPAPVAEPLQSAVTEDFPAVSAAKPAPVARSRDAASSRQTGDRNGRVSTSKINGRKRRKQYNFHLFYSDMIMNLTRWNYMGGFGTYVSDYSHGLVNGDNSTPNHDGSAESSVTTSTPNGSNGTNGHHMNGSNGSRNAPAAGNGLSPDAARHLAIETSKLIENQQKLIEGQRKLIEDQNKLIQEKSKLIDFETSVLGKQSELIGDQELL